MWIFFLVNGERRCCVFDVGVVFYVCGRDRLVLIGMDFCFWMNGVKVIFCKGIWVKMLVFL